MKEVDEGGNDIPLSVVGVLRGAVRASSAGAWAGVTRATALAVEGLDGGVGTAEDGCRGEDADVNHVELMCCVIVWEEVCEVR